MIPEKYACALLLNDVHVSKDNISEFQQNWTEALEVCGRMGIVDICIGGDLWQSRAAQTLSTLMAVRAALLQAKSAGCNVLIAEGNHCKVDQESIYGYSHIFSEYPNVDVVDVCNTYSYDTLDLHMMSYFPENGSFATKLEEIAATLSPSQCNVLYIHQGINGALATSTSQELSPKIFKAFDKVLVGHYHDRCVIPKTNVEYIGSSRQHNFGEDEHKGYTILYSDGSTEFVENQVNRRYITLSATPASIQKTIDKSQALLQDPIYKVKVKLVCSDLEAQRVDKAQLIECGFDKIDILSQDDAVATTTAISNLDSKFDKDGVIEEWTTYCDQKSIAAELGVKYLNQIQ